MKEEPLPYERQPRESSEAWEAFRIYRDLDGKRSHRRVADQVGKAEQLISKWSRRWDWVGRVHAWDSEQDRVYRQEVLRERARIGRRHAQTAEAWQQIAAKGMKGLTPETMSARELLDYAREALRVESGLYGLGEHGDDSPQAVRIFIDSAVIPEGAQLPENPQMEER